jgi:MerR family transcriptional regulator, light-induced transcriptional regulator
MPPRARLDLHRHPMRVVTRRTGLSADLLRAWERRYEVVTPSRSPGGRRLYSDADIERLRLLYRATLAGRTIGQVAELPTPALATLVRQDAVADAPEHGAPHDGAHTTRDAPALAADYLAACLAAVERLDVTALDALLWRAAVALPGDVLFDTLVASLLDQAGTPWRGGALGPRHAHLLRTAVRRLLDGVIERAGAAATSGTLIVATPVGQGDEMGALLMAAAATVEGWRVMYLGADLNAADIADVARQTRARAVVMSIVHPAGDRAVSDELRWLRTGLAEQVAIVVGGVGAAAYAAVLDDIGAGRLDDLASLRVHLRTLGAGRRRRVTGE